MNSTLLSLIVPTYNERANVELLVTEIRAALAGLNWEILFVDDSDDGTDVLIGQIANEDTRVRVMHRQKNRNGLAGAVVAGMAERRGKYICVLDADLQHPPAKIRDLLDEAERSGAEIVVASRYLPGGSAGGLEGPLRNLYSQSLRILCRLVFPLRLKDISDPLAGYFLVRDSVVRGVALRPVGYKILLEILVRGRWRRASEVPYRFQLRRHGTSKADYRQGLRFFKHLGILLWDCSPASPGYRGRPR